MFKAVLSPHAERTLLNGFNRHHVLKGLVYFEDVDKDPGPEMLVDFSWAETKRFFVAGVGAMSRV